MAKKKKNEDKEPVTQVLEVIPEPPPSVVAETSKLVFHLSPLSSKGLLSQQVRDALKALQQANKGAQIVKLRAFVAGTGDLRRVSQITAETFTERRQPIPVVTTVQVGSLPMEGAQVQMEATSVEKRAVNPSGLIFFATQPDPAKFTVAGSTLVRLTCMVAPPERLAAERTRLAAQFPQVPILVAQPTRSSIQTTEECEAIARANSAPPNDPSYTYTKADKLVLSTVHMAVRDQPSDLRLAFDRLGRVVDWKKTLFVNTYSTKRSAEAQKLRGELLPGAVATEWPVEGLPSLDAPFAIEAISRQD